MDILMNNIGKPIDVDKLQKFENEIGHVLPSHFRTFLLKYNGGRPAANNFFVPGWKYSCSLIQNIKGIKHSDLEMDLIKLHDMSGFLLPENYLFIGSDPGGNKILIGLAGENRGKIYFWDHEEQPDDGLPTLEDYRNIYFIANTFEEFMACLKTYEEMGFEE